MDLASGMLAHGRTRGLFYEILGHTTAAGKPAELGFTPADRISGSMTPKRILLVEHSAPALRDLARTLHEEGFDVLLAEDGAGAVNAARRALPDLILLTVNFPPDGRHAGSVAWDGFLILRWMREQEELKATPVVILGEEDSAELRDKARAAGAAGYFPKSRESQLLIGIIRQILPESVANRAAA